MLGGKPGGEGRGGKDGKGADGKGGGQRGVGRVGFVWEGGGSLEKERHGEKVGSGRM